jgi:stage 0 sporulation regulatory protein
MINDSCKTIDLKIQINNLRNKMILIGKEKGLSHPETLKCSEQLDKLIYKLQKLTYGLFVLIFPLLW